jgi:capsular polysaccharide biosynthesis protein
VRPRLRRGVARVRGRLRGSRAPHATTRSKNRSAPGPARPSGLFDRYASLFPEGPGRTIVYLADEAVVPELADQLAQLSGDRVVVLSGEPLPEWQLEELGVSFRPAAHLAAIHRALKHIGPVDVLVNLRTGSGAEHLKTWQRLFFHVRKRGAYAVARRSITHEPATFVRHLGSMGEYVGADPSGLDGAPRWVRQLAAAVDQVVLAADAAVVTKRVKHLLKAHDEKETTRLLNSREDGLAVVPLATLPSGVLRAKGSITSYETSVPLPGLDSEIPYPQHYLRRYEGRIGLAPNGVAFHGHVVLPDSFRWHREKNPVNPRLINVNADFARLREQHRPRTELTGSYYFLDYSNSGHFGHLMTEAVAKFWGWDVAKEADPDLKVLLRRQGKNPNRAEPQMETRLLEAYGVAREDMVWVDEPVWVDSLVGASPMWHNKTPYHAHPGIRQVWDRLRRGMVPEDAPSYPKIFVSRRAGGNRACRNVADVEEMFAAHGFEVIRPERLDLAHQAGVFAGAEVVAGFGGSALFSLMYAEKRPTLIVLNQEAYDSRNEHLYAAVLGCDAHYFWSAPDIAPPASGWSYEAFQSPWTFDFARNEADLKRLLESLA